MKVSMDGLRRNAIRAYNKLCYEIKHNIKQDEGPIEQQQIEECMEDLRNVLVTLACSYQQGEDGWKEMEDFEIDSLIED